MPEHDLYAPAQHVTDATECDFYHVLDLPGIGLVGGDWDLRGREDAYLGGVDFAGKRVLEMGTASGHLGRYMEGKGAEVVGFDASPEIGYDHVPFAGLDIATFREQLKGHIRRMDRGWWLAHRLFGLAMKKVYGNIYEVPEAIGAVDIATFGAILLHLRDPFHALCNGARLAREKVIVTELNPTQPEGSGLGSTIPATQAARPPGLAQRLLGVETPEPPPQFPGTVYFLPSKGATHPNSSLAWWNFPPEVICRFLGVLGFEDTAVTEHDQIFKGKPTRMYTVVGTRTKGKV